jgi:3-oxoacyl-(acyl-carrier-protein) synthase/thioesterase domain-containing protein/acyl carrier protein
MSAVAEPILLDKIAGTVASTLKIPVDRLDVDADFDSFGMDSIIAIELMTNLSKQLKISITPAQLTAVNSIRQLAGAIGDSALSPSIAAPAPAPIARPAVAKAPTVEASAANRRAARSVDANASLDRLLAFVRTEYGLDLRGERFASRQALIDHMVEHHADALYHYYNLSDAPEPALSADLPVSASETDTPGIAIVGIACEFADAKTPGALWQNLIDERSSIRPLGPERWPRDDGAAADPTPRWGALIDDVDRFDATFFGLSEDEARMCDPQERRVMQALYHALQNAGIRADKLRGTRTGLFLGYEYAEYEHLLRRNLHRVPSAPALSSSSPIYYLANRISFLYDFKGPSEVVNASCASSALAIHRAAQALAHGECDLAICGGVSLNLFADDYAAIARYGLLSSDGSCAVFDDDASGFTRGEGLGLLVLKRMTDAERDNSRIYAKLAATHQNNRGRASFISEIKHEAITQVIRECYEKHAIAADSVRYIEVDGYATKWGDSFEFEGIRNAFPPNANGGKSCALGSIKGNIGHVEPASGVASTIKIALALHHKRFPATITKKKLSSFIDIESKSHPLYIADRALAFDALRHGDEPIRAAVNSFADSGVNVHLVLEEHRVDHDCSGDGAAAKPGAPQLFVFSARTPESLRAYLDAYVTHLRTPTAGQSLEDMAYSMQVSIEPMAHRLAVIAAGPKELIDSIARASKLLASDKSADSSGQIFIGDTRKSDGGRVFDVIQSQIGEDKLLDNLRSGQLKEVALLWTSGIDMPWNRYWQDVAQAHRGQARAAPMLVDLPSYPFASTRYWLDFSEDQTETIVAPSAGIPNTQTASQVHVGSMEREWHFVSDTSEIEPSISLDPEEKIRLFMAQESACLLRTPLNSVDEGRNFLELGYDSVGMATLIQRLIELLGESISPSLVFKYQDIAALGGYLAQAYREKLDRIHVLGANAAGTDLARRNPSPAIRKDDEIEPWFLNRQSVAEGLIVPMQTQADGTPIFAVPGADGSVFSLQTLSQSLAGIRPLFAFEAVGLDGKREPLHSIAAMADAYIEALSTMRDIRRVQLLGYSNGAVVAFEMARKLSESKIKVDRLVLVDRRCPALSGRSETDEISEVFVNLISKLGGERTLDVDAFKRVPESERGEYLYAVMKDNGFEIPREQFLATLAFALANDRACRQYKPAKIKKAIDVVIVSAKQGAATESPDLGWNRFLTKHAVCVEIDADHLSVVGKEASTRIARIFQ